ncbi:MAG TPA: hypothetical protein VLL76_06805, partial [Candidatus Omnitrophota bacterium]|nr:hypothetical protein [Candidatus Omnitrophota bacterium]
ATIYVATSKAFQDWASDVGLGKNVYKIGIAEDQTPDEAVANLCGCSDWKVLKAEDAGELTEAEMMERLARKEKLVDPNYYPRLRGEKAVVKANLTAIENNTLVALALDGREPPKNFKIKPVDVAEYLIRAVVK